MVEDLAFEVVEADGNDKHIEIVLIEQDIIVPLQDTMIGSSI